MKEIIAILAWVFAVVALVAVVWMAVGAVFYFGLPILGVDISFGQSIVLTILITVVGRLFNGSNSKTKEDE